jgi:hypothetical protein
MSLELYGKGGKNKKNPIKYKKPVPKVYQDIYNNSTGKQASTGSSDKNFSSVTGEELYIPPPTSTTKNSSELNYSPASTSGQESTFVGGGGGGGRGESSAPSILDQIRAKVNARIQEEIYATLGIKTGGFEPDPNTSYESVGVPFGAESSINADIINSLDDLGGAAIKYGRKTNTLAKIGKGITQVKPGEIIPNTRNLKALETILKSKFSIPVLGFFGAWAGSVLLGSWAETETVDAHVFPMDKLAKQAIETGDWTAYDQTYSLFEEATNESTWDEINDIMPWAGYTNSKDKVKATAEQGQINHDAIMFYRDYINSQQASTQSSEEMWDAIRMKELQTELFQIDYYNSERQKLLMWELEAKSKANQEEADYWAKQKDDVLRKEREQSEYLANYWFEFRKKVQDLSEYSNLKFGLL